MRIKKKPAAQIMRDTFRYYEGSKILRELGYRGCGNYWWYPGMDVISPMSFAGYHQTFGSALRDPRAQRQMQVLYWNRAVEQAKHSVRKIGEAFRRLAENPQIQAVITISEKISEAEDQRSYAEAWEEIAEAHERRALRGEAMLGLESKAVIIPLRDLSEVPLGMNELEAQRFWDSHEITEEYLRNAECEA